MDVRTLFERRLDTLYRLDAEGRMVGTNEWASGPAPRFHLMITAEGPIWRFGQGVSDAVVRRLGEIAAAEPRDRPLGGAPLGRARYLEALGAREGEGVWSGPAYMATGDVAAAPDAVAIDARNAQLLARRFPDWLADVPHRRPFLAVVAEGAAAALCASVRISPWVHCAGVETHPDYRRRGFARAAVAAWARAVRTAGATPFYSTSWDNLASQGVARSLGFTLVGADFHIA